MNAQLDLFQLVTVPQSLVTIHNALLVNVRPADDGSEVLTIEHQGITRDLPGGGRWSDFSLRDVGRHGYLVPMTPPHFAVDDPDGARKALNARGAYFRAYPEPSLRRVFELDRVGGDGTVHAGWLCDDQPHGFTAPPGLIPGKYGQFVPDETVEVSLRVPPEFVRECRRVQRTPQEVLRGFIGDAAGIESWVDRPRADGYGSNGSDEREMASAWINRAYGVWAIDIYAAEAQDEENALRQDDRDDIAASLDDYIYYGGQPGTFISAVQALVENQRIANEETDPSDPTATAG